MLREEEPCGVDYFSLDENRTNWILKKSNVNIKEEALQIQILENVSILRTKTIEVPSLKFTYWID